jgi:hypothetical protein
MSYLIHPGINSTGFNEHRMALVRDENQTPRTRLLEYMYQAKRDIISTLTAGRMTEAQSSYQFALQAFVQLAQNEDFHAYYTALKRLEELTAYMCSFMERVYPIPGNHGNNSVIYVEDTSMGHGRGVRRRRTSSRPAASTARRPRRRRSTSAAAAAAAAAARRRRRRR